MGKYIWIDCDPGVDDAATILLASKSDKYKLIGLSTVAGNTIADNAFENARRLVEFGGGNAPVYRGADKPILREPVTAAHIHGADGLGGVKLPLAKNNIEEKRAWDALYEAVCKYGNELEVLAVGPLTNICIAISKYPDLVEKMNRLIIMGGSTGAGNTTPAAEFNIYEDPEAAEKVFTSGLHIMMFGLDVTMKSYLSDEDLDRLKAAASPQEKFLSDCLQISNNFVKAHGLSGVPLHDACTMLYLEKPELFKYERAWAAVETEGEITRGRTVTDLYSDKQMEPKNVDIVTDVDRNGFVELFFEILGRYR